MKILGLKHFSLTEIEATSKNPAEIDINLLLMLDKLRDRLGVPIKILDLDRLTHADKSLHYKGQAADIKITGKIPANTILQAMLNVGFNGIGYYSGRFWHCDIRTDITLWKRISGYYLPLIAYK